VKSLFPAAFLLTGGTCHAYVFDLEVISPEHHYEMDRDIYNHSRDRVDVEYYTFQEWEASNERREERMHEWAIGILADLKDGFKDAFGPTNESPEQSNYDHGRD